MERMRTARGTVQKKRVVDLATLRSGGCNCSSSRYMYLSDGGGEERAGTATGASPRFVGVCLYLNALMLKYMRQEESAVINDL